MDVRRDWKRYYEPVRLILLRDWDPIGVSDIPEAQDEYDGYVLQICGMLMRQESRQRLVDHLWWVESEHMGMPGDRRHTEEIADRLIRLREETERGESP
jgi:hypothetical protein